MKKPLALASSFVLVFATPVALPTKAHAQGGSDLVRVCKIYVDLGFYDSVGECVGGSEVSPVCFCQFLKEEGQYPYEFDDETIENQGDCVRWFRHHR